MNATVQTIGRSDESISAYIIMARRHPRSMAIYINTLNMLAIY
jgi:hypothetical protein